MNKVFFIGRLTADPNISVAQSGNKVARYSLAVERNKEETDFIRCTCFAKTADFVEKHLTKGMKVAIIGRLQTGSYTDKDGNKRESWQVVVDQHEFCEARKEAERHTVEDELPFM